jgi:hypothetical protein
MMTIAALAIGTFFVYMGMQSRNANERQRIRKPLPRAVLREKR